SQNRGIAQKPGRHIVERGVDVDLAVRVGMESEQPFKLSIHVTFPRIRVRHDYSSRRVATIAANVAPQRSNRTTERSGRLGNRLASSIDTIRSAASSALITPGSS